MRRMTSCLLAIAAAAGSFGSTARADTVTNIDISGSYNGNWSTEINGAAVAAGAQSGTGNAGTGLSFSNSTGQYVGFGGDFSTNTVTFGSLSISLNANAVVNTLLNQFFGGVAETAVTVTFTNSLGATDVFNVVSGETIRDYNNDGFTNSISGGSGTLTAQNWWNTGDASMTGNGEPSQRLDAQTFVLPASWSGTDLTQVSMSNPDPSVGDDILTAMQVDDQSIGATPLPAALPLFAGGLGAMGLLGWRRKRKAQAAAA